MRAIDFSQYPESVMFSRPKGKTMVTLTVVGSAPVFVSTLEEAHSRALTLSQDYGHVTVAYKRADGVREVALYARGSRISRG